MVGPSAKVYNQVTETALREARVVVLWSKAAVASDWVRSDATVAMQRSALRLLQRCPPAISHFDASGPSQPRLVKRMRWRPRANGQEWVEGCRRLLNKHVFRKPF